MFGEFRERLTNVQIDQDNSNILHFTDTKTGDVHGTIKVLTLDTELEAKLARAIKAVLTGVM